MEEGVKPIKPSEVIEKKKEIIPAAMIQAVNDCIAKHWNGTEAEFKQDELIERYFEITGELNIQTNRQKLFTNRSLDFEPIYRKEGWDVKYDKPAYTESYPATFTFRVKKGKK